MYSENLEGIQPRSVSVVFNPLLPHYRIVLSRMRGRAERCRRPMIMLAETIGRRREGGGREDSSGRSSLNYLAIARLRVGAACVNLGILLGTR